MQYTDNGRARLLRRICEKDNGLNRDLLFFYDGMRHFSVRRVE
jgi:hypothetical protein